MACVHQERRTQPFRNSTVYGLSTDGEEFRFLRTNQRSDAGYKFIVFGNNPGRIGGTRLKSSARSGADRTEGQRRTGYIMGGGSGEDPIGSILRQSDAAERMEVELFTRLEDW
ncbi:uncharacterized protein N7525_011263 [Penicillium rubens]|uniref:uncharacterized protein n=1 Tax=Penicillium rubens TaxID=1108849 RepID=UPI002A5A6A11|nr:uncharacterized protein N7525_011263 [Penicillium rubens]KAJ5821979.1 hypothetical protein N7525_011263 [Penicillium rubens]KAJ5859618.1 hypothetical protein N7534_004895 [Penicillium rubens]